MPLQCCHNAADDAMYTPETSTRTSHTTTTHSNTQPHAHTQSHAQSL